MKIKKIFTNTRIIILILALIFAYFSINPAFNANGVAIRNVLSNSSAAEAGFQNPNPTAPPRNREVITSVNNVPVSSEEQFFSLIEGAPDLVPISLQSSHNKNYILTKRNNTQLGLTVYEAPSSNIRRGLDLEGGTRVLLQPEDKLSPEDTDILIANMKKRLNVYGLSDLIIREANDLPPPLGTGNQYIIVEIAGATKGEVADLLAKQGKFEAKIGNDSIFFGGDDVKAVGKGGQQVRIECLSEQQCRFSFPITISIESARRFADATKNLAVLGEGQDRYLEKPIDLFLDDVKVDNLSISSDLRGRAETQISISGPGVGLTQAQAREDAVQNMKQLQTVLETGSLPTAITIVKTDTISPLLGEEFIKNAILVGLIALLSVAGVIFIRYRSLKVSLSMAGIMFSELFILLGLAALIGQNLDLAAIAGLIIVVGSSVDHQIVITDETVGKKAQVYNWKKKLKTALFIIMAAYFTTVVAMIPLLFAGAGLLQGFAITTILGVSIGVFITRPAYAALIEVLLKE